MVFVGISFVLGAIFLTQSDWSAFFSNQLLCVKKHWEWGWVICIFAEFSNSERTYSFHKVEVGKAVPRVRKKNIPADVKNRKIWINCLQKRCFISANLDVIYSKTWGELTVGSYSTPHQLPSCKVCITTWCSRENRHPH